MSSEKEELRPVIGVDPGLKGGLACLQGSEILFLERMPLMRGVGHKMEPDPSLLVSLFESVRSLNPIFYLEKVGAHRVRGRRQGVVSMFSFGKGFGLLLGVAAALRIPVRLVPPQTWKAALKVRADKQSSISRVKALFPQVDLKPGRMVRDHDGLAEALLIAVYGGSKEWL